MSEDDEHGHDHEHDHDDEHGHDHDSPGPDRVTSPMQDYGTREVAIGAAIATVGLLLTFGLALIVA